jgi:hypothetical protein
MAQWEGFARRDGAGHPLVSELLYPDRRALRRLQAVSASRERCGARLGAPAARHGSFGVGAVRRSTGRSRRTSGESGWCVCTGSAARALSLGLRAIAPVRGMAGRPGNPTCFALSCTAHSVLARALLASSLCGCCGGVGALPGARRGLREAGWQVATPTASAFAAAAGSLATCSSCAPTPGNPTPLFCPVLHRTLCSSRFALSLPEHTGQMRPAALLLLFVIVGLANGQVSYTGTSGTGTAPGAACYSSSTCNGACTSGYFCSMQATTNCFTTPSTYDYMCMQTLSSYAGTGGTPCYPSSTMSGMTCTNQITTTCKNTPSNYDYVCTASGSNPTPTPTPTPSNTGGVCSQGSTFATSCQSGCTSCSAAQSCFTNACSGTVSNFNCQSYNGVFAATAVCSSTPGSSPTPTTTPTPTPSPSGSGNLYVCTSSKPVNCNDGYCCATGYSCTGTAICLASAAASPIASAALLLATAFAAVITM